MIIKDKSRLRSYEIQDILGILSCFIHVTEHFLRRISQTKHQVLEINLSIKLLIFFPHFLWDNVSSCGFQDNHLVLSQFINNPGNNYRLLHSYKFRAIR